VSGSDVRYAAPFDTGVFMWPSHAFGNVSPTPFVLFLLALTEIFHHNRSKTKFCFVAVNKELSQSSLQHLRWMLQKDLLGQDVFLIGRPGPLRRHLAMQYLEMTGRELEYVALSRDTTEADLKQRREIQSGTAKYFDQVHI
jgi:hypothetical protein